MLNVRCVTAAIRLRCFGAPGRLAARLHVCCRSFLIGGKAEESLGQTGAEDCFSLFHYQQRLTSWTV
jgi:hypothetical protein